MGLGFKSVFLKLGQVGEGSMNMKRWFMSQKG